MADTKNNPGEKIWKYIYWLDDKNLQALLDLLKQEGRDITFAKQNPCEALHGTIGCAEPHVWEVICKYDAAPWYRNSKHAEKSVIASSFPLPVQYSRFLETTITVVTYEPEVSITEEEKLVIAKNEKYISAQPGGWGSFPAETMDAIKTGLSKLSGISKEGLSDIQARWDAVHSNFVNPKFRGDASFFDAPFSIDDSIHISSCCVEFFNLFDSPEKAFLVRPCIGGVIVKAFTKDQYYFVRLVKNI